MRKASAFAALLFLLGVLALGQQPRAQLTMTGVGGGGFGGVSVCVGYTGPGDVPGAGSALLWGGLRAYTAALCGNALANVCNSTGGVDVGCADMFSSTTTGALISATVGGITCPGANCTVKTLYDQTLGNNCTGSCNLVQATIANRPTLVASCAGLTSRPCMQVTAATQIIATAGSMSLPQPFSWSVTGIRVSGTTFSVFQGLGNASISPETSGNVSFTCDGTVTSHNVALSENTWRNLAMTCVSGNIGVFANGSSVYTNSGSGTNTESGAAYALYNPNGETLRAAELGIYNSDITSATAALSTNQQTFLGF